VLKLSPSEVASSHPIASTQSPPELICNIGVSLKLAQIIVDILKVSAQYRVENYFIVEV
jgi:hypothetical protein